MSDGAKSEQLVPAVRDKDVLGQSGRSTTTTIKEAKAVIEKVREDQRSRPEQQKPTK
ncbi:MAG TPA: hypothetical protein VFV87_09700 [Pirellulaceae bacterium]|nr:hypothetical protein [Pirellulaceae bacterium]